MAMPARKLEWEVAVEDRLGKLEAHVEHIRTDISDLKVDVRRLNDKIDGVDKRLCDKIDEVDKRLSGKIDEVDKRLNGKIDEVDKRLGGKIDNLRESMDQQFTKLNVGRAHDRVWFLLIGATILGVMAHGFKWI